MIKITNQEAIPEDLRPGKYNTRIVRSYFEGAELVIELEFLGTRYMRYSCLIPLVKEKEVESDLQE